jgi:hypothetical protein
MPRAGVPIVLLEFRFWKVKAQDCSLLQTIKTRLRPALGTRTCSLFTQLLTALRSTHIGMRTKAVPACLFRSSTLPS